MTVPITTMVLSLLAVAARSVAAFETMRESDIGGRLMRDIKRRRRTILLKFESVRPVSGGLVSWSVFSDCGRKELVRGSLPQGALRTGKETVKLHQELKVDIFALRGLSVVTPNVVALEIDT